MESTQENGSGREERERVNTKAVRGLKGEQRDADSILPSKFKGVALSFPVRPIKKCFVGSQQGQEKC